MSEPTGNGNGGAKNTWLSWVNTVLIMLVGGLLVLYSNLQERRLDKIETELFHVSIEQAQRGGRQTMNEEEIQLLRRRDVEIAAQLEALRAKTR